eukprot:183089_1
MAYMQEQQNGSTSSTINRSKAKGKIKEDPAFKKKLTKFRRATHAELNLTLYEYFKMAIGCVLVPLRLLFSVLFFAIAALITRIFLIGFKNTSTDPLLDTLLPKWRRNAIVKLIRFPMDLFRLSLGFRIRVKGSHDSRAHIIVSNHISFLDPLTCFDILGFPSALSKIGIKHVPLFGTFSIANQAIYVDRSCKTSRSQVKGKIASRANFNTSRGPNENKYQPIIVFPEGTTSNGRCVMPFKRGAFLPGLAVQPLLLRYPHRHCNPAWTNSHSGADGRPRITPLWLQVWRLLSQFRIDYQIEYLPVYFPTEEEQKDPDMFAKNVETLMARKLGVPVISD